MALVKPPTPVEFEQRLLDIRYRLYENEIDKEDCHLDMDDYILKTLDSLGYEAGVKVFRSTPKWYS